MGKKFLNLNILEEQALIRFGKCCGKIKSLDEEYLKEYPLGHVGLFKTRLKALYMFERESDNSALLSLSLLKSLIKVRPHWEQFFNLSEENHTREEIIKFFVKCSNPTLKDDQLESFTTNETYDWKYLSPGQGFITNKKSKQTTNCIIHPRRIARKKGDLLCNSCIAKLTRLNLLNYQIDLNLIYVLKMRLGKLSKVGKAYCHHHPKKLALRNGFCSKCNKELNLLDSIFREIEIFDIDSLIKMITKRERNLYGE